MRALLHPLYLAALLTWGAVALSLRGMGAHDVPLAWALMVVFLVAMAAEGLPRFRGRPGAWVALAVEAASALGVCALATKGGAAPVLLVVLASQLAMGHSMRLALGLVLLLDVALYLILLRAGHPAPLLGTLIYAGFQGFAMVVGHATRTAEAARDALAHVNADQLATRALMADAARDTERLRVARELHDVAGHTLTALNLNLRVLAADPGLAAREELQRAQQLTAELMEQIRGVVHAIRDARGLDLETALRALAAPMPDVRIEVDIAPDAHVQTLASADVLLRTVQEALTNAVRHGAARVVRVSVTRRGDALVVDIDDDGRLRGPLRMGNGLTGMRERVEALGGQVDVAPTARGGVGIHARVPA